MKIAEAGGGEFGGLGKMFCKIRQSTLQWQRKLKPGFKRLHCNNFKGMMIFHLQQDP
jgi:hypothetical protein